MAQNEHGTGNGLARNQGSLDAVDVIVLLALMRGQSACNGSALQLSGPNT